MHRFALLLFALLFTAERPAAANFPPLPSRNPIDPVVWADYSHRIIKGLFPTRPRIGEKPVVIVDNTEIFVHTFSNRIEISTRLIQDVADENEYATTLVHWLGHELWQHSLEKSSLRAWILSKPVFPDAEDFLKLRLQEAEADLADVVVTGNLPRVYNSLKRQLESLDEEEDPDLELARSEMYSFRLNILSNLHADWFHPIIGAGRLPGPLPEWNQSTRVWQKYTREILRAMYPNYKEQVQRLIIGTNQEYLIATGGRTENDITGIINLNLKFLSKVIWTVKEFAVLIGHEFGHTLLERDYTRDYPLTDTSDRRVEIRLRKEYEADLIGTLPFPKGECIWANVMERVRQYRAMHVPNGFKYDQRLDLSRIKRLRAMCMAN